MQRDPKRESGFYWVRFEGEVVVAEYTADGAGWSAGDGQWWRVPGSSHSFEDDQVCELLSARIPSPAALKELISVARGTHLLTVPCTVTEVFAEESDEVFAIADYDPTELTRKTAAELYARYGHPLRANDNKAATNAESREEPQTQDTKLEL